MINSSENGTTSPASWRIDSWFPDLSASEQEVFKKLDAMLKKFSKSINLVSSKSLLNSDAHHFADCIMASRIIVADQPRIHEIFDFGSGNGFPGLVFSILNPKTKVILVDSDQRKCEYLKACTLELNLKNVSLIASTVESLPLNSVQFAMSRGLANISRSILLARKCMVKGGMYYHLKGEQWGLEVSQIPTQLCSIWSPALVKEYKLPLGQIKFSIVKTEKIK